MRGIRCSRATVNCGHKKSVGRVLRTTWKFKSLLNAMHSPPVRHLSQSLRPFLSVSPGDGRKPTVKRAKQVRRDAQVLLDCRWFAKAFTKQRLDMLREQRALSGDHEEEIEVICTLASHLKLQVRRSLP